MPDKDYNKIEKVIDNLAVIQTVAMLNVLAKNLTTKTKLIRVPIGTYRWKIIIQPEFSLRKRYQYVPCKEIMIPLQPFFGMYVGYDSEYDILVCWQTP